jgi:hypothetical protein
VDPRSSAAQRIVWAFWLACGLAAIGGLGPLLLTGPSGRVSGVVVPFGLAAVGLAACAVLYGQGRTLATGLYFVAGLAIVYGSLSLMAVPLRLAVIGTCPPAPAQCTPGFEHPLTGTENVGLEFAIGMGIAAVLVGFFGLVALYRHLDALRPELPPLRRIPPVRESGGAEPTPVTAPLPAAEAATTPELAAPEPQAELPAPEPDLELPAHEPEPELPAPEPEPELPAPEPEPELPAPAPEPELPPHVEATQAGDSAPAPTPKRQRKPRGRSRTAPPTTGAT